MTADGAIDLVSPEVASVASTTASADVGDDVPELTLTTTESSDMGQNEPSVEICPRRKSGRTPKAKTRYGPFAGK
jgi:hypothetical protein